MRRLYDRQRTFMDVYLDGSMERDPMLERISRLLAGENILQQVRRDLVRNLKRPRTGRQGVNAEQTIRLRS